MKFFKLLNKESGSFLIFLILLGLIDSVWISSLLAFIDSKMTGKPLPIQILEDYDSYIYLFMMVLSLIVSRYFQVHMIKLTCNFGNELAVSIFDKLRHTNYNEFKGLGQERVRTLMNDVQMIQTFPALSIELFKSGLTTIIGIIYMFYIDFVSAIVLTVVLILISVFIALRVKSLFQDIETLRDLENVDEQHINNLLRGFKEVKTSIIRNNKIFKSIKDVKTKMTNFNIFILSKFVINTLMATYSLYAVIGIILFVLPLITDITGSTMGTFVMILLFISGSIALLASQAEQFSKMNVAYDRIEEFENLINVSPSVKIGHGDLTNINENFESIRFENVVYEHLDKKKNTVFTLGPINLEIRKSESVFIMGGNGSGKSTFINLLTGLCVPISGNIYINDHKITPENYPFYRDQISSIYTDTYLFDQNYNGFDIDPVNTEIKALMDEMKITDIVKVDQEKKIFNLDLSKGQQKRVALIYSLLEKKDVIVLDEWAAEQDPEFRKFFYTTIVKKMVDSGKAVIAVTHDDEYFNCADRLIEFKYGKVHKDSLINKLETV